eukprot:1055382-Pelagomonas_calceolata.AAC.10
MPGLDMHMIADNKGKSTVLLHLCADNASVVFDYMSVRGKYWQQPMRCSLHEQLVNASTTVFNQQKYIGKRRCEPAVA